MAERTQLWIEIRFFYFCGELWSDKIFGSPDLNYIFEKSSGDHFRSVNKSS